MQAGGAELGRGRDGGVQAGIRCLGRRKKCGRASSERRLCRARPDARAEEGGEEGEGGEERGGEGRRSSCSTAYPRRLIHRRRTTRQTSGSTTTTPTTTTGRGRDGGGIRVLHTDDADGTWCRFAPSGERHGRLAVLATSAGCCSCSWWEVARAGGIGTEHHMRAERVQGRTWGWRRGPFGEPGGVALARSRHGGLLAWGGGARNVNVNVNIGGAADSSNGGVMFMAIIVVVVVVVVIALLSTWVGGGERVIRGRG